MRRVLAVIAAAAVMAGCGPAPTARQQPAPAPAPVAPPAAPAPPPNPDADRYAREIASVKLQRQGLQASFDEARAAGDVEGMREVSAEMRALRSWTCLEAEQRRGALFYPALTTCRSAAADPRP